MARINAAFALARSAARLTPLTANDPRTGAARGTPASGSELASTLSDATVAAGVAVAVLLVVAVALAELAAAEAAEDELDELLEPLVELPEEAELEEPAPALAEPPVAAAAAAAELELEDELLEEAAEAIPAESRTAKSDSNILFIFVPCNLFIFANVFDQTHPFFLPDYDQYRNTAGKKGRPPWQATGDVKIRGASLHPKV